MPRFRVQRHLCATLSAVALAFCVAAIPGFAASASGPESHAVRVSMHAVLRSSVGVPVTVDVDLVAPADATINSDGMLTIPKDAVKFTTDALVAEPVPGTAISRVDVVAESDVIGWIDTSSGVTTLQGDLVAKLSGSGLDNCPIGPAPVVLASTNVDGLPYDPDTATATVTTPREFGIPAIVPGASGCMGQEAWINAALGLGIPGTTSLLVDLQLTAPSSPPPPPSPPASGGSTATTPPASSPAARPGAPAPATAGAAAAPKITASTRAKTTARKNATTGTTTRTTTTTAPHVWPTDDTHTLVAVAPEKSNTPTTFGRTPIAAEFPVADKGSDRTSMGIGVLIASLGAGIAGFVLLRSEARKLFRRRARAAF